MNPVAIVGEALQGTGLNIFGSCGIEAYDQRAPRGHKAPDLMPRARGVVVVGSAGRDLWGSMKSAAEGSPRVWSHAHPVDTFVAALLDRADVALGLARVGSRRFEPTLDASPSPSQSVDFRALGELVGLGSMGPFGLLIHQEHGAWWALRGAWLVDVEVPPPSPHAPPCAGCAAPCLGSVRPEGIMLATALVRGRCVVGQESRYTDEQIAYHYDREATLAKLRAGS